MIFEKLNEKYLEDAVRLAHVNFIMEMCNCSNMKM